MNKYYYCKEEDFKTVLEKNSCYLKVDENGYSGYYDAYGTEYFYLIIGEKPENLLSIGCKIVSSLEEYNILLDETNRK